MQINKNQEKNSSNFKWIIFVLIFILAVVLSLMSGYYLGFWEATKNKDKYSLSNIVDTIPDYLRDDFDSELFWNVWNEAKTKHVDRPIEDQKLFYGALAGLISSLDDPYSLFLDPDQTTEFNKELSGSFEGIGTEIGIKNNLLTIIAPLDNSPAEKAGLKSGDIVLKIDDEDTIEMSLDMAVSKIRGPKGTKVVLTVMHSNESEIEEITIERNVIVVESVTWEMLDNNIAYIKIVHFNNDSYQDFSKIANDILLSKAESIILDLRSNPGGYLDTSVDIAGEFLENKIILTEDFGDDKQEYTSDTSAKLLDYKLAVLINNGSASAAEILAGALQDYSRGTLIGEQTFGKGSVQDFEQFSDGSSLKLTVAKWLTPNGHNIDDQGITPDIEVELTDDDYNNDLDPQLEAAIHLLTE
ncbi:MAG: S41 family peptidase [bacterium]|nr:S41 family peptidase [bacterium]